MLGWLIWNKMCRILTKYVHCASYIWMHVIYYKTQFPVLCPLNLHPEITVIIILFSCYMFLWWSFFLLLVQNFSDEVFELPQLNRSRTPLKKMKWLELQIILTLALSCTQGITNKWITELIITIVVISNFVMILF